MRPWLLWLAGAMLLTGCAGEAVPAADDPVPPSPAAAGDAAQGGTPTGELTGTLGGDASLEGGCAWLETPDGRYEVVYPGGYEIAFDPLRLTGPDGEVVAEQGDQVTVAGRPDDAAMSVCQVGSIWSATSVAAP